MEPSEEQQYTNSLPLVKKILFFNSKMVTEIVDEIAEIDDFNVIQSVCSGHWDDMAEDYVDKAGQACLEAIVATPPTLALHEVTADPIGVVGIQVNRPFCRDHTRHPLSPGAPSDVCLVVSFLRDGEVFATTPVSQPLKCAKPGADEFSVVSDVSSLSTVSVSAAGIRHGSRDDSLEMTAPIQQIVGMWGKTRNGSRETVTFDSCLEIYSNGESSSNIDVVIYLVDTSEENFEETVAGVPLAVGRLRIEGNSSEKSMLCDIPLHEPLCKDQCPFLQLPNPNYMTGQLDQTISQRSSKTGGEKPKTFFTKKKKGFAKFFSGRKRNNNDEEKKSEDGDDTDGDDDTNGLCNSLSPFINDAYLLDQVQGAFLRFQLEWKEKETNFEVNLHNRFPPGQVIKENSIKTTVDQEDGLDLLQEMNQPSTEESLQDVDQPKNQKKATTENSDKPSVGSGHNNKSVESLPIATAASSKAKKPKGKSFFFKKKKRQGESTLVKTLPEPNKMVVSTPEERQPLPEPCQKVQKAAVLLEIRERSLGVPDTEEVIEVDSIMSPSVVAANTSRKESEENNEKETNVTSIIDTMCNAVIGQVNEEGSTEGSEREANSISATSYISQKSSDTSKKEDFAPSGTASRPVLSNAPIRSDSTTAGTNNVLYDEGETASRNDERINAGKEVSADNNFDDTIARAPTNGLYAQFLQATSSLLQGSPRVEFKKTDANSSQDPMPALEVYLSPDFFGKNEGKDEASRRQSGPIDLDAVDDGEIGMSDDEAAFSTSNAQQLRVSTPSPQELSMERILSWDDERFEEQKSQIFGFGRKHRDHSTVENATSAPSPDINPKKRSSTPPLQVDASSEKCKSGQRLPRKQNEIDSIPRSDSLTPPSSLPRNPRILYKKEFGNKETRGTSNGATTSERDTTKSLKKTSRRTNPWGKLFRSKSASSLVGVGTNQTEPGLYTSPASVVSDADTTGIDNVAKPFVTVASSKGQENTPNENLVVDPNSKTDRAEIETEAFIKIDEKTQMTKPNFARPNFSLLDMCGPQDSGAGPVRVDDKEAWLYAKDDESYATETNKRSVEDDLTLIPSPADVFLSETYYRCGPGRIADLGDALIEETRHLVNKSGLVRLQDKSDAETFRTLTFDEPTFDPSILSGDSKSGEAKSASMESRTLSARSGRIRSPTPSSRTKVHQKGVSGIDAKNEPSKIETFSKAFMSFVTCRSPIHDTLDHQVVPSELFRHDDSASLDDLTLTTHEMQVEIEQYKKKIEQLRNQTENLDENGDEVGDDAVLIFQPPSVERQNEYVHPFGDQ